LDVLVLLHADCSGLLV